MVARGAPGNCHGSRQLGLGRAIAAGLSGAPGWEAGFQSLSALREAHRLEPSTTLAARLRAAMAAFVAAVPHSLPERATVLRWQAELSSPAPR